MCSQNKTPFFSTFFSFIPKNVKSTIFHQANLTSFLLVPLLSCNIVMYVFYKVLNLGKFGQKVWQSELRSINGPGSQSVNRTMAAYSIFKFQNVNMQCYFTQKLRGFRLGNKKNSIQHSSKRKSISKYFILQIWATQLLFQTIFLWSAHGLVYKSLLEIKNYLNCSLLPINNFFCLYDVRFFAL